MHIIETVALVVNSGWLVVALLLVVAVKKRRPQLSVPFLVWGGFYLPFCLAVACVCLRRVALLAAADRGRSLLPPLVGSALLCLLAAPLYLLLLAVVEAGRRQMRAQRLDSERSRLDGGGTGPYGTP
ncbi:uncharacterized protein LOC119108158 [Pollicipes pollicipes]|uniref:uncharacterized protein LOC119108158 n=1 Tax=Pollicipes pollicipes TaxID=41117 RepID=UPI0018854B96|nr:uncharacterized protein LOC119108158 [Pollicipes pollicipes]